MVHLSASAGGLRWPKPIGSPVLDSLRPVIEHSREVRTHIDKIIEVAGWMAYEDLPLPEFTLPFGIGTGDPGDSIDFIPVADSIDTAFTDFKAHTKFQVEFQTPPFRNTGHNPPNRCPPLDPLPHHHLTETIMYQRCHPRIRAPVQ